MSNKLLSHAMEQSMQIQFSTEKVLYLMGHSILFGLILAAITFMKSSMARKRIAESKGEQIASGEDGELQYILNLINDASTILFLCVGLSGVMILVNNSLARAFAIAAGLALVRMRINIGKELSGPNLLFGVIAGIACGLEEIKVAWASTFIYLIVQTIIVVVMALLSWGHKRKNLIQLKKSNSTEILLSENK